MVDHLGSSYAAGFISVLMLALARVTRFGAHLQGAWHVIYVLSAGAALYFNLLLGVVGASSQTEPSLFVAQFAVVLPFVGVTVAVPSTSRPSSTRTPRSRTPGKSHHFRERSPRWPR